MKTVNINHLGPGNVGKTFLKQFVTNKSFIEKRYRLKLKLLGIFNSKGGIGKSRGLSDVEIKRAILTKDDDFFKRINNEEKNNFILNTPLPSVVIDTTASDKTKSLLIKVLKKDGFVVTSNKKPLSTDWRSFRSLFKFQNRLFFETTVGAGLPVVSTVCELRETCDQILEIDGCFSGTLGYIFSLLEKGENFSKIVNKARLEGFTEPDPRDDLSGLDVARKALILARILGGNLSLEEIKLAPLYPKNLNQQSVEEFLNKLDILDNYYHQLMTKAAKDKKTLRYIAKISKKSCSVGLRQVDLKSDFGTLAGPDNLIVIRTKRYFKNPLVIKGPGAGVEVTAGGVFGDLLKIIKIISL